MTSLQYKKADNSIPIQLNADVPFESDPPFIAPTDRGCPCNVFVPSKTCQPSVTAADRLVTSDAFISPDPGTPSAIIRQSNTIIPPNPFLSADVLSNTLIPPGTAVTRGSPAEPCTDGQPGACMSPRAGVPSNANVPPRANRSPVEDLSDSHIQSDASLPFDASVPSGPINVRPENVIPTSNVFQSKNLCNLMLMFQQSDVLQLCLHVRRICNLSLMLNL